MPIARDKKQEDKMREIREQEAEDLAQVLAKRYNYPYVNLSKVPIDLDAMKILDEKTANEGKMVVFKGAGKNIQIGILTPNNLKTKQILEDLDRKGFNATVYMVSELSLEKSWAKYVEIKASQDAPVGLFEVSVSRMEEFAKKFTSLAIVKESIEKLLTAREKRATSELFEIIFAGAVSVGASDIHLEPTEENVRMRWRLDGVLHEIVSLERSAYKLLLSRLKLLSGMKLNITDQAQDGRISIRFKEKDIEIRSSIIPQPAGESVVMRLLDPKGISVPLEELGIEPHLMEVLLKEINRPNGMLLTTGPTGSGKTTALYAFLRKIYNPEIKIITLEDPVEYHLPGIVQTQIHEDRGYTFADGLRAILRQDPDIIMVGEIRDPDTGKTAIQASLTGHFVLSTLHTNNAAGVIPRLLQFGIDAGSIPTAINVAMAQRLLRRLCKNCKEKYSPSEEEMLVIKRVVESMPANFTKPDLTKIELHKEKGCDVCGGIGYKGRVGIYEALIIAGDKKMEEVILHNPSETAILEISKQQGILNMQQDGIIKVLNGLTSLSELQRILDL